MTELFQLGDFTSHAGLPLEWKIECDAINNYEWDCLATMIMMYQHEPFSKVLGIPRGGLPLQKANGLTKSRNRKIIHLSSHDGKPLL